MTCLFPISNQLKNEGEEFHSSVKKINHARISKADCDSELYFYAGPYFSKAMIWVYVRLPICYVPISISRFNQFDKMLSSFVLGS